jgi:hypothetical protein
MIPKLSAPLVKDIRTGEGILEWLLALLGIAAGATGNLSIAKTGTYLTILAAIKGTRRLLVKVLAGQAAAGIDAPIAFTPPPALSPEKVLAEIHAVAAATDQVQSTPGTPAEQVTAGLAPDAVTS